MQPSQTHGAQAIAAGVLGGSATPGGAPGGNLAGGMPGGNFPGGLVGGSALGSAPDLMSAITAIEAREPTIHSLMNEGATHSTKDLLLYVGQLKHPPHMVMAQGEAIWTEVHPPPSSSISQLFATDRCGYIQNSIRNARLPCPSNQMSTSVSSERLSWIWTCQ